MSKSMLIISRQAPWAGPAAREALDIALAGGAFDLPLAMLFLVSGSMNFPLALLFSAVCGMSNGMVTIARGTVSLALFGRERYGAVIGDLAIASLGARACGPVALAWGLERAGLQGSAAIGLGFALAAVGAMEIVAIIDRRHRQEKSTQPA